MEDAVVEQVLVTDPAELGEIARSCRETGVMAVAVLNRTLDPIRGEVAGVAIAAEPERCFYLPVAHEAAMSLELGHMDDAPAPNLPALSSEAFGPIREVLADPGIAKVGHDLKRSLIACRRAGLELAGSLQDVLVASYVLDPGRRRKELAALSSDLLGRELTPVAKVLGTGKNRRQYGDIAASEALAFACEQVEAPLRLWHRLRIKWPHKG